MTKSTKGWQHYGRTLLTIGFGSLDVKEEVHGATGQRKEELVFLAMLSELTMLAAGRFADDPRRLSPDDRVRQLICRELRIPTRSKRTRRRLRAVKVASEIVK
jgi:hypothetical protein